MDQKKNERIDQKKQGGGRSKQMETPKMIVKHEKRPKIFNK